MIKYCFKDEWVALKNASKADPQKIGEALAGISTKQGGRLEPEHVVNAARDAKNVLHKHFEWDDKVAAHAHRLDQARGIIRSVRVLDGDGSGDKPAFISIADRGVSYRSAGEVADSRVLQLAVLAQAERELEAFERRYAMLKNVCQLVAAARDGIRQARGEIETRTAA